MEAQNYQIKVDSERAYNIPEVASILGISRTQVYNLINRGELRAFYAGQTLKRSMRIGGKSLEYFIASREITP